jgi:hypothetical protein
VIDLAGKSLKEIVFMKESDFVSKEIQAADLRPGMYFLKVVTGNKTEVLRVVKL